MRRGWIVLAAVVALAAACTNAGLGAGPKGRGAERPIELPTPAAGCGPDNACPEAGENRPHYELQIDIPRTGRTVRGTERVEFTPDLDVDRIVFRLWPNAPPQREEGASLTVSGVAVTTDSELTDVEVRQPEPTLLEVPLDVAAGETVTLAMEWTLRVPRAVLDRLGRDGDTVWLGSFYPILPWMPGVGWALDPPTTSLAEASTSPTADYDVTIGHAPGLTTIGSGARVGTANGLGEGVEGEVWKAVAVRDFAVAVGDFETATTTLYLDHPVEITVGVESDVSVDPEELSPRLGTTLGGLAAKYGSYPWSSFSMTITRAIGRSGIEYPTMVFEGADGIDRVTTHELAHQWFYSLVGNDQARDPWLDELFATWAAARLDGYLDYFAKADFPPIARNHVGAPMTFWDQHSEQYEPGVYFRGVQVFTKLGNPAKVDAALREYVADNAFGIATPRDLGAALTKQFPDAAEFLEPFGIDLTR